MSSPAKSSPFGSSPAPTLTEDSSSTGVQSSPPAVDRGSSSAPQLPDNYQYNEPLGFFDHDKFMEEQMRDYETKDQANKKRQDRKNAKKRQVNADMAARREKAKDEAKGLAEAYLAIGRANSLHGLDALSKEEYLEREQFEEKERKRLARNERERLKRADKKKEKAEAKAREAAEVEEERRRELWMEDQARRAEMAAEMTRDEEEDAEGEMDEEWMKEMMQKLS